MDRKGEVKLVLQFWLVLCVAEVCLIPIVISMKLPEGFSFNQGGRVCVTKTAQWLFKTNLIKDLPGKKKKKKISTVQLQLFR